MATFMIRSLKHLSNNIILTIAKEKKTDMERPSRKTKLVNYSDFQDLADDDDFASVKAPPSKKAKESVKEPAQEKSKKSSNKASSQETSSQSIGHKNRKPLDEKLYDRDLEAALTLSLLKTTEINEEQCSYNPEKYVKNQPQRDGENLDPSLRLSNSCVDINLLGLDQITNDRGSPCAPSRQRKAASKATEQQRSMLKDGDEDYNPKGTPDSESDADFSDPAESDDDEFTVKKPKKKNTEEKTAKKEQPKAKPKEEKQPSKPSKTKPHLTGTPNLKTPTLGRSPTAKPASVPKRSPGTSPISRPAVSGSPAGGRIPKWNPPGHVGRSPSSSQSVPVKSPGQGLRLGLSRMVRVKPLHPSVASH
ncbi:RAD51-associated protein 1 isoform X1 [Oncorhynchus mykiss]|uniref:RAD51 associated protein 1 n=1 Tax=Oncorhynchus mykiss TaxID=8022 RepID=A0A8C7T869_ONCMY|nr:RAD51-associated protein 1 isoform X1 [Oncorhynchus mykiss]